MLVPLGLVLYGLLAQAPPPSSVTEPISGGAGWVGAGLLGLVLGWLLLKHLPDKDRQTERLVAGRDEMVKEITKVFGEQLREVRAEFKNALVTFQEEQKSTRHDSRDALNTILLQHDRQVKEVLVAVKAEFESMARDLTKVRDALDNHLDSQQGSRRARDH